MEIVIKHIQECLPFIADYQKKLPEDSPDKEDTASKIYANTLQHMVIFKQF